MACKCDPCECGTVDLGKIEDLLDNSPWYARWPVVIGGLASGAYVGLTLASSPIGGAVLVGFIAYEAGRAHVFVRPPTKESVASGLAMAEGAFAVNGTSVTYTGLGDPLAGDPAHMAAQQKAIDDLLGALPSEDDLCKCGKTPLNPSRPPDTPISLSSPLVLDLNGDGVKTTDIEDGVYFDHDGNRFAGKSGWVGAEDALLVRDVDGNGRIDSGKELFGNNTELSGGGKAANGFAALAEFDSNGDGVVDKNDERWSELKLWQDRNGDGVVDDGELLTLEEAGVAGINVSYKNQNVTDENGNKHLQGGTFIREDGTTGVVNDVWFENDPVDTEYLDDVEVSTEIKKLPNLRGWGEVRDMHQVMATDGGRLQGLMEQYLAADSVEARELVWDIILAWTGMTDVDPASYPRFNGDARKLFAMEALTGTKFGTNADGTFTNPYLGPNDHKNLETYFTEWESKVSSYLALSTHYAELYSLAVSGNEAYDISGDSGAYEPLMAVLRAIHEAGGDSGTSFIADFIRQLRVYDSKGIACADVLKYVFIYPQSDDTFIKIISKEMWDWVLGADGNDVLTGSSTVDDALCGSGGNDTLKGSGGNDVLWGGAGDDRLEGGAGDDVYRFGRGDGHDVIVESENRVSKQNIVSLGEGIGTDDVEFLLKQSTSYGCMDLVIRLKGTGETLTVMNAIQNNQANASNNYSIQGVTFADGTKWTWADVLQHLGVYEGATSVTGDVTGAFITGNDGANTITGSNSAADTLYGGGGNDTLNGMGGNDILWGGAGDDALNGAAGDDVYVFGLGDGHDVIRDSENRVGKQNVVSLGEGIGTDDVEFLLKPGVSSFMDLVIRLKGTGETLTVMNAIQNNQANASNNYSIQGVIFADGTKWTWADVLQHLGVYEGATSVTGDVAGSFITGNDGANTITGSNSAADTLYGGGGNDTLNGMGGNDILWGGAGDDKLNGAAGDDVYKFGLGDGADTLTDNSGNDTLQFGEGIDLDDIWFARSGNDLVIDVLGSEDSVNVKNWFYGAAYQVESITVGGMELVNTQMNQLLQAMAGFGVPAGVDGQWTEEQKEAMAPVLSGYWKPAAS